MQGFKITLGNFTLNAAIAALFLSHTPVAAAHARWDPAGIVKPRNADANLKGDPCGAVPRTTTPATFAPGQTIEVTFQETVNHPGHFRIAFSPANDQGFNSNILLDNIPDTMGPETPTPHLYRSVITLPMQPCDACSLQLIQVMTDSNTNYYSCSDIKLATGSSPTPTPAPSPTPTPLPASTDIKEIAQNLLDDFLLADTDKSSTLTLDEAQLILPGLKLAQFSTLDKNSNGTLTTAELKATITPPVNTETKASAASVDWTTLLMLVPFALRRIKKS